MVGGPEDEIVQIVCEVEYVGAYYTTCETVSNGVEDNRGRPEAEWKSPVAEGAVPPGDP